VIDLAIRNGTLIDQGNSTYQATLIIQQGRIVDMLEPGVPTEAVRVIDAEGMLVLPGAIDIHFHCRAPAFPERGDFATETRAAAAGGVTTVFEMPISKPGAATAAIWHSRRRLAERDAYVNVGLYGSPGLLRADEIAEMAAAGAVGFKFFLTEAPEGREDEFEGLIAENLAMVAEALELIRPTGLRCVFHAEDQSLLDYYTARARTSTVPDYRRHNLSRPPVVESVAVAGLLALAWELQTPIHIAHVTTSTATELIRHARAMGAPVTAETCPHYLFFTEEALATIGPYGKINPPLRSERDRQALWQALEDGVFDVIASDHAPFTAREKEAAWDNILEAPPGHPGVEALLPLALSEALKGRYTLERAVELISTRPAQLFDLFPQKGTLRPGADADVTIYDPRETHRIQRSEWMTNAAECNRLYDGMEVQGRVQATIVGGKVVYEAGRIIGEPGDGRIVRPLRVTDSGS
jgi:allantoinase